MAKKAKLDVLDIPIDERIKESPKDAIASETEKGDMSGQKRSDRKFSFGIQAYIRKPLFWITTVSVVLFGSIMGISILPHKGQDTTTSVSRGGQAAASYAGISAKDEMVLLTGFAVDLKDGKDNMRIAFCDIALEPEKVQSAGTIRSHAGTRSLIYGIIKGKKAEELLLPELRTGLKTELKNGLNGLFGEDLVRSVYFLRIEVI